MDELTRIGTTRQPLFKEFPEFSKLTAEKQKGYEKLIQNYPAISDISFIKLIDWWDHFGEVEIATLDGNVVISYGNYFDDRAFGFSLVGTNNVDASLSTIFDYLRQEEREAMIINVPEFVVHSLEYPELFKLTPSPRDDEYIVRASQFADIEKLSVLRRSKIKRFMRNTLSDQVEVRSLDLSSYENRKIMIGAVDAWPQRGINALGKLESRVLRKRIDDALSRETHNVGVIINNELQAFCLYYPLQDPVYVSLSHARVNYDVPGLFDFMTYAFSRHFTEQGFEFVNLHSDLDSIRMRVIKLALKPVGFFRKYTVEPS